MITNSNKIFMFMDIYRYKIFNRNNKTLKLSSIEQKNGSNILVKCLGG